MSRNCCIIQLSRDTFINVRVAIKLPRYTFLNQAFSTHSNVFVAMVVGACKLVARDNNCRLNRF